MSLRPLLAAVLCAGIAVASSAQAGPPKLGQNLVVNPGFEDAVAAADIQTYNPLPPTGWTVEGATILFDHKVGAARTGKRMVAISGSLAPGKQVCDASSGSYQCAANPAHPATSQVNEAASSRWSVRPYWVTAAAIPVVAGKTYRFGMWAIRPSLAPDAGVVGEGAEGRVRWVDATGATIKVADGPRAVKTAKRTLGFKYAAADLVAPAGAVGAKLLLGHTDWTNTSSQVAFDDITFQQLL